MSPIEAIRRRRVLFEARERWRKGCQTGDVETSGLLWEDQVIQWAVESRYVVPVKSY